MANCRSEPLVVESTRWPALILQPTRQVSPTTIGKSIPDIHQCHLPVPISATSMPHQCLPLHINATYQCPSELPFSVTYQCQSVPPISASQCYLSVPPISASQCCLSVSISAAYQCRLTVPVSAAYQCQSVPPISAAYQCHI
ncbi:unnamed protein product [Staurois parvus]|uniref:Uncharacterized protein n=1 Tax=Staurois parvus TaxID=386267 RepID=A0ABN9E6G3_9NEOB|nr:unnamed protein product [Staurois parvus]